MLVFSGDGAGAWWPAFSLAVLVVVVVFPSPVSSLPCFSLTPPPASFQPTSIPCLGINRFCLILRMVYMFVFHGVEEDIRSDNDEGEKNAYDNIDAGNGKSPAHGGVANGKSKSKTT